MSSTFFLVQSLGPIKRNQARQCPGALGPGEWNQNGEYHPLVPPAINEMGVRRSDCIAVTTFAIDIFSAMSVHSVVAGKVDYLPLWNQKKNEGTKDSSQTPDFPPTF
jgi:hypothetical protein